MPHGRTACESALQPGRSRAVARRRTRLRSMLIGSAMTLFGAMVTHEVLNQPPPLPDYDPFAADPVLPAAVEREGGAWATAEISAFARTVGRARLARDCTHRAPS